MLTSWNVLPRSTCQYWAPAVCVELHWDALVDRLPSLARPAPLDPSVLLCRLGLPTLSSAGASGLPATQPQACLAAGGVAERGVLRCEMGSATSWQGGAL